MHCHTARGQWAVEFLQCTATLLGGQGVCLTAWGQWAVEALSCTATLLKGSGQCNSCNALPHCLRAVCRSSTAHCPQAVWQCIARVPFLGSDRLLGRTPRPPSWWACAL